MPATYEKIATTTLGSNQQEITFSSITSAYTDLRIVLVAISSTSVDFFRYRFNGDTGTNYSNTELLGDGSSALSQRNTDSSAILIQNFGSSEPALFEIDLFSYAGSTYKTTLNATSRDRNGSGVVSRSVGLWRNTAAITSITLRANTNFASGTIATIYGILKA
jgi:hypothetical protein